MKTCQAADCSNIFEPRGVGTKREKKYCSKKCFERARRQTPHRKAYLKEHQQTPKQKAWRKAWQKDYDQTPHRKAYLEAWRRNNPRAWGLRKHAPFLAQRDGHLCRWCRRSLDYRVDDFHIDHIWPQSKGGSDDRANLCLSCPTCNLRKSNRMPDPTHAEQARFDFPLQLELPLCPFPKES